MIDPDAATLAAAITAAGGAVLRGAVLLARAVVVHGGQVVATFTELRAEIGGLGTRVERLEGVVAAVNTVALRFEDHLPSDRRGGRNDDRA